VGRGKSDTPSPAKTPAASFGAGHTLPLAAARAQQAAMSPSRRNQQTHRDNL